VDKEDKNSKQYHMGWQLLVCAMREEEIYRNTGKDAMIFEQHFEESHFCYTDTHIYTHTQKSLLVHMGAGIESSCKFHRMQGEDAG